MDTTNVDKVIEEFNLITKNTGKVQDETLKKILKENGSAEYLQNLGLNGRTDPENYKASVPLATHQDFEPYIQRIADGDSSPILTGKPIRSLSLSSGTTQGKSKFVPFNEELMDNTLQVFKTSYAFRNREFPVGHGKALMFIYSSKQGITKGGLATGTPTTHVFRNPRFKDGMKDIQSQPCSPDEVIFGPDFRQSLYCHLLCGLIFHDQIQLVYSSFAHSIVRAFQTFEKYWEELIRDIRDGELSNLITAPSIRAAISKVLKPNPELADLIHGKCSRLSDWHGLIPELFPNVRYVYGIMTGSMEPYVKKLRHYAGNVPLCSADYGASEGWIALNVNPKFPPESATFVVLPDIGYFEFIPLRNEVDNIHADPKPVGLTEVKVDEEYEVVVTNFAGLYRYRLGDVVKVVGFYHSSPEIKFVCRKNLLPTINFEKNTEKDLQLSVEKAGELLAGEKLELVDFTCIVDTSTDPGHYVIFWEIIGEPGEKLLQECCNCLDQSFNDAGYITSRRINAIGPLELRVVSTGTFQKILDHYISQGAAASQFKTPRCVRPTNNIVLQIVCDNVAKTFFSTAF